ncbi:MAG: T9SS type A sorting domain-containing protein [Flavobacteriales bacterium]
MRFTLLPLLVLVSALSYGQSHSIDDYELILEGTVDQSSPAQNTYYNALEEVTLSWSIVTLEGPSEWDFSFCFPNCYDIGVTEGDLNFTAGTEQYLNCHVYPNQTPGTGMAQMEIVTNGTAVDTVTWMVTISAPLSVATIETEVGIFPNPASSETRVGVNVELVNSTYVITDLRSHRCVQGTLTSTMTPINTAGLPSGRYTLSIITDGEIVHKPLLIQR